MIDENLANLITALNPILDPIAITISILFAPVLKPVVTIILMVTTILAGCNPFSGNGFECLTGHPFGP